MNKLTDQEKAIIFAKYFGCQYATEGGGSIQTMVGINTEKLFSNHHQEHLFEDCAMLLTPLSNLSDEHAIQLFVYSGEMLGIGNERMIRYAKNNIYFLIQRAHISRYLELEQYNVPMFFSVNHWANGKTPIELGLAIDPKEIKKKA